MVSDWNEDERGELLRKIEWLKIYKFLADRGFRMHPAMVNDDDGIEEAIAHILDKVFGDDYDSFYADQEEIDKHGLDLLYSPEEIQYIVHWIKHPAIVSFTLNYKEYDEETKHIFREYMSDFMPKIKYWSSGYECAECEMSATGEGLIFYAYEADYWFGLEFLNKLFDFIKWCEERTNNFQKYRKKGCENSGGLMDQQHGNSVYGEQDYKSAV